LDENNLKIIFTAVSFLASLIGIFLNFILSRKSGRELNRGLEICNKVIIERYSSQIKTIAKAISQHFRNETSRVLEIAMRDLSVYMNELKKESDIEKTFMPGIEEYNIKDIKNEEMDFDLKNSYKEIKKTNDFIRKIESAALRAKLFRWAFVLILAVVLSFSVIILIWPLLVPTWLPLSIFIVLTIFLISFAVAVNKTSDLINRVEREYGISI